ncbi:hypothetical protein L2E82_47114 [Cichorium intybus]|uniref:Uncharacterized protein n=1 Tax=Cichorium intybus TaxID=13427 RepID=A0ACB8YUW5_CICIN|nr:hypothetical protein L2E82_47114 [Cichorium intybus]
MQSRFRPAQSTDAAYTISHKGASYSFDRSRLPHRRLLPSIVHACLFIRSIVFFLVISGCKEFSPTNNTHCNRRLYIASCLRLSVPVRSCRTQISLSISI